MEKWLGSIVNAKGVRDSTVSTIAERKSRIMNIIYETIAIVEDSRIHRLGGLRCAKEIWELAIIPALLNNSETFYIHDKNIQKSLENFQSALWRGLLELPKSCPLPSLAYESDSLLMKYRVYSRILNFVKHIHSQSDDCLSKQIMTEQLMNDWPGLTKQALNICEELNVRGLFDTNVNKRQFKALVKTACLKANNDELKQELHAYKKMAAI